MEYHSTHSNDYLWREKIKRDRWRHKNIEHKKIVSQRGEAELRNTCDAKKHIAQVKKTSEKLLEKIT